MVNKELFDFVCNVMGTIKVDMEQAKITFFDDRRIVLFVDDRNKEYVIRTWNINKYCVRYSVFEMVGNHGVSIIDSQYYFFN